MMPQLLSMATHVLTRTTNVEHSAMPEDSEDAMLWLLIKFS
jgi:hypothetical protein